MAGYLKSVRRKRCQAFDKVKYKELKLGFIHEALNRSTA